MIVRIDHEVVDGYIVHLQSKQRGSSEVTVLNPCRFSLSLARCQRFPLGSVCISAGLNGRFG
jgi:hypothetical protein